MLLRINYGLEEWAAFSNGAQIMINICTKKLKTGNIWSVLQRTWNLTNVIKIWDFPGGSGVKNLPVNAGDAGLISGWERFLGGGNGNPLQYFCLGNPMDRGVWWTTVHGVAVGHNWSDLARTSPLHSGFPPHLGHHRALSRVPELYSRVNPSLPNQPTMPPGPLVLQTLFLEVFVSALQISNWKS